MLEFRCILWGPGCEPDMPFKAEIGRELFCFSSLLYLCTKNVVFNDAYDMTLVFKVFGWIQPVVYYFPVS